MSQAAYITIPLRDGTTASVERETVRVGERAFAVAAIQDARQVAPNPETVALRVANERTVVELQPALSGDGMLLLEAIFRLRPSLRPAGFEMPANIPPGFPPDVPGSRPTQPDGSWNVHSTWPPHAGVYLPTPGTPGAYAPPAPPVVGTAGVRGGRFAPTPRTISEIIGSTFELFTANWRSWLLLGFVAVFIPEVIHGGVDALFQVLGGGDLWAGVPMTAATSSGNSLDLTGSGLFSGSNLLLDVLDLVIGVVVGALIGGWIVAVLGIASRNAIFGHPPAVNEDLRAGLKRLLPATVANILSTLLPFIILLPLLVVYGVLLTRYGSVLNDPNALDSTASAASTLACLSLILLPLCVISAVYVSIRLALAPYIAATEPLGPVEAMRKSWSLTHRQWWHTFIPILAIDVVVTMIQFPVNFVEYASFGGAVLIVLPLVQALTAPLSALVAVVVLYDLRLRREGYAAVANEGKSGDERVLYEGEPLP